MLVDPLIGAAEDVDDILGETLKKRKDKGWDYAVCLTDLPIFYGKYVVAADNSYQNKISQISIPAFGWVILQGSVKNAIIHILKELIFYSGSSRDIIEEEEERISKKLKKNFPIYNAKRIRPSRHPTEADVRYIVVPKWNGRIRLLIGMTQSNRPMSIMGSFKKILATAFTTGTFGLIFTTMWNLGIILSAVRLTGLMTAAVSAMTIWIIFNHNLWEGSSAGNEKRLRRLYNMTTLSSLFISVTAYYVLLWVFFLTATLVLIPPEVLQASVSIEEEPGLIHYVRIAWVATSISTIAGAIGAGMENEEMVRDITYGYRQKRRDNGIQNQE